QWNASGEANGCGSAYGYFVNAEGIPGIYMVEILNGTSSVQFLNSVRSRVIGVDYPEYPARVGFDGAHSPISVSWAFVFNIPPEGIMPEVNVSKDVYPSGFSSAVHPPVAILYYVPIEITNRQLQPTQDPYQQLVLINSSEYSKYEATNLQNVEFFYANGTVIPSWLQSGNSNTAGIIKNVVIRVSPAKNTILIINGQVEYPNSSGLYVIKNALPGKYYIMAENPYYRWYFNEYTVDGLTKEINITLEPTQTYLGEGIQYPWAQIGPSFIPNPFNQQGSVYFNASGHIGLIQIDPRNADVIYIASGTASDGIMGPIGDGGVYVSYNDGRTWLPRDFGLPYGPASALYMDPSNPDVLLVAINSHGIYRTDDGGLWWYQVSNITNVNSFQESQGVIFAGSQEGIIESRDDGQSWKIIYPSQYFVGPISVSGSVIYAMVWGPAAPGIGLSYIYFIRSTDLGSSWAKLHTFIGNYPVFVSSSPFNSSVVYADYAYPNSDEILYSDNGGLTFTNLSIGPLKDIVFD
ncbi:MAG: WD40/YVTN/BNR-like repeat-containing protein, partial [Nitrososphaeria archaeon]